MPLLLLLWSVGLFGVFVLGISTYVSQGLVASSVCMGTEVELLSKSLRAAV